LIAAEESGISVARSLPRCRIIIAKLAIGVARAVGCDTSFCSRTCAMPIEHGVGIVLPLTSTVWRPEPLAEIIRRKLMPNLEQVTWRDPQSRQVDEQSRPGAFHSETARLAAPEAATASGATPPMKTPEGPYNLAMPCPRRIRGQTLWNPRVPPRWMSR
jgi:hypothetical protein